MPKRGAPAEAGLDKETLELTLESIRSFIGERLPEAIRLDLDAREEFPVELIREISDEGLGIHMLFVPEEFGGMGAGIFDLYRVAQELARADLGIATSVLATILSTRLIAEGGSPEQQRNWLTRVAENGLLMACCATEPEAGSDLAAIRCTAERVENPGRGATYRLSGNKQWVTNGGYADIYSVLARAPGGLSWFLVPAGTPGLSCGSPERKHGIRASNTAAVMLEGVDVGADSLVGGAEGCGLAQAGAAFGYARIMVAAFGIGAGWEALDRAISFSTSRVAFGGSLSENRAYTHKLIVPHAVRLEAGRAFLEETAERVDAGETDLDVESAIAKYVATEAGNLAADAAIQALGGYGYSRESMVEKIRRDLRITTIYEGTSELLEMTIARGRWKDYLRSGGRHYHEEARRLQSLAAARPESGAGVAALALRALAGVLETARLERLTRHPHILLRLGELIAWSECAAALARRAVRLADGAENPKAELRFRESAAAALSRVFAREIVQRVASDGTRWVVGAGGLAAAERGALQIALDSDLIRETQTGLVPEMDYLADVLYERV